MPRAERDPEVVVSLTEDEREALVWAAYRGSASLRSEGWKDMARNAEILDHAREKLESPDDDKLLSSWEGGGD